MWNQGVGSSKTWGCDGWKEFLWAQETVGSNSWRRVHWMNDKQVSKGLVGTIKHISLKVAKVLWDTHHQRSHRHCRAQAIKKHWSSLSRHSKVEWMTHWTLSYFHGALEKEKERHVHYIKRIPQSAKENKESWLFIQGWTRSSILVLSLGMT